MNYLWYSPKQSKYPLYIFRLILASNGSYTLFIGYIPKILLKETEEREVLKTLMTV